ncbi:hypothetical protein EDC04DRAFT_2759943 [Pisolithus marmoratus]|nr:hypothetical protein EDC04DRAFT_2759943 [Pisolithus marmoratus]
MYFSWCLLSDLSTLPATCNLLPDIGMIFPGSCMMQAVVYRGINYGLMRRLQSKLGAIVGESRGGHRCHIVNCTDRVQL